METPKITAERFESICREASERRISSAVATGKDKTEPLEDYLYTVWWRVAQHLKWDDPHPLPKSESQSDVEWLRGEAFRLVADNQDNQSGYFQISPVLHKYAPKID